MSERNKNYLKFYLLYVFFTTQREREKKLFLRVSLLEGNFRDSFSTARILDISIESILFVSGFEDET